MSGQFVVVYAGMPARFNVARTVLLDLHLDADKASVFHSEDAGWLAAYKSGLTPSHTTVKPLSDFFNSARDAQTLHTSGGTS